jgi:hypothetical protein
MKVIPETRRKFEIYRFIEASHEKKYFPADVCRNHISLFGVESNIYTAYNKD